MWDKIKKAINSNLAKPLDTFMTEQFNSWATQRGRIDAAISSRATNDGVWLASGRFLSSVIASNTAKITSTTELTINSPSASNPVYYKINFFLKTSGKIRVIFDSRTYSGGLSNDIQFYCNGVLVDVAQISGLTTTYATFNVDSPFLPSGVIEVVILTNSETNSTTRVKNVKICYSFDDSNSPTTV